MKSHAARIFVFSKRLMCKPLSVNSKIFYQPFESGGSAGQKTGAHGLSTLILFCQQFLALFFVVVAFPTFPPSLIFFLIIGP